MIPISYGNAKSPGLCRIMGVSMVDGCLVGLRLQRREGGWERLGMSENGCVVIVFFDVVCLIILFSGRLRLFGWGGHLLVVWKEIWWRRYM